MPIRGLDLVKKSSLNTWVVKAHAHVLKDSIVAIDGFWFIRKYVSIGNIHDLFINRCDERFLNPVVKLLKMASASKFQILWVWDGLDYKKPTFEDSKDDIAVLKSGYQFYKKKDYKMSNNIWRQIIDYEDIIIKINNLLKQFGHEAVRAPYSATAQIAYYLQTDICSYAFCKTDTLIFEGVEKIITDLHLENVEHFMITVFNKKDFMKSFELSYQNFRILAFVLGCEFCPTIPEYADNFIFENILTIIKTRDIDTYFEEQAKTNKVYEKYLETFYTSFVLIDFHPVMKEEGLVTFYKDAEVVPSDFEEFFGKKLPNEVYSAFFFCEISKNILESISKNKTLSSISSVSYKILNKKYSFKEEVRSEGARSEEGRSEGVKSDQVRSEGVRSEGVKSEGVRSEGGRSEGVRSDQVRSEDIAKNIKFSDKLSKLSQILIYHLASEGLLKTRCLDKLICTANYKNTLIKNNDITDYELDYDLLEFVYNSNKILQELKDCIKLVNKSDDLNIDLTNPDIFMFPYLHYKENKEKDDSMVKFIKSYLICVSDFAKLNLATNGNFKQIIEEISI